MAQASTSKYEPCLWPAFGLGLAVATGNGLARFAYALLLPAMREDLLWTYAQAGWLNTANALGYVVGATFGYWLLAYVSPARLFALGLCLTFISLPATGLDANLSWLSSMRLISGIGAAWVFACGSSLIADRYKDDARLRGTATGLFFAGAGLGIALSSVTVYPLLAYLGTGGWPQAWLLLGVLAALLSIWPLWEALRAKGAANQPSRARISFDAVLMPLLGYFAFAAGYIIYMTFILAWLDDRGWSWTVGMWVWMVLGFGVAISPFVWRPALDRWPATFTLSASCAVTLSGTGIALLDTSAIGLMLSALVFGLGVFIAPSSIAVLVRQRMPANLWAKGMTFFTVIFAVGQSIGPVAAGWIADQASLERSLWLSAALLLISALLPLCPGLKSKPG